MSEKELENVKGLAQESSAAMAAFDDDVTPKIEIEFELAGLDFIEDETQAKNEETQTTAQASPETESAEKLETPESLSLNASPANQIDLFDVEQSDEALHAVQAEPKGSDMADESDMTMSASSLGMAEQEDQEELNESLESGEPLEFIEADQLQSIIESLLFSSDRPVSTATIKQIFKNTNVRNKDIARALDFIAASYADATRGVTLEEINGGYQLRTKVDNAEYLKRLNKTRPFRLSGPALEVLSIVAYKQPIVKFAVDEIRGVESGHLLRALMERGLVNFAGKSDLPGRPMQYGTTRKFLEIFGLRNLKELPTLSEIDQLIPEGIGELEEENKMTLSDITDTMAESVKGSYSDGEDELLKISDQLAKIDSSSEFFEKEKIRQREQRDRERAQNIQEAMTVGEAVDEKDIKWLRRYEAQLEKARIEEALRQAQAAGAEQAANETTENSAEALHALEAEMREFDEDHGSAEMDRAEMSASDHEDDESEDLDAEPEHDDFALPESEDSSDHDEGHQDV